MKQSMKLRIVAVIILAVLAVIDMLPFTPVTAFGGVIIILFRPKWFFNIVQKLYDLN